MTNQDTTKQAKQLDRQQLELWVTYLGAHSAVISALEQGMDQDVGLPLSWYDVLVQLSMAPERKLRLGELAESVILTRSGITRLLDRMVAAGLVRREPAAGDRRGYFAVLTDEGHEMLTRAAPGHSQRAWDCFIQHIKPEEFPALQAVFDRVLHWQSSQRGPRQD